MTLGIIIPLIACGGAGVGAAADASVGYSQVGWVTSFSQAAGTVDGRFLRLGGNGRGGSAAADAAPTADTTYACTSSSCSAKGPPHATAMLRDTAWLGSSEGGEEAGGAWPRGHSCQRGVDSGRGAADTMPGDPDLHHGGWRQGVGATATVPLGSLGHAPTVAKAGAAADQHGCHMEEGGVVAVRHLNMASNHWHRPGKGGGRRIKRGREGCSDLRCGDGQKPDLLRRRRPTAASAAAREGMVRARGEDDEDAASHLHSGRWGRGHANGWSADGCCHDDDENCGGGNSDDMWMDGLMTRDGSSDGDGHGDDGGETCGDDSNMSGGDSINVGDIAARPPLSATAQGDTTRRTQERRQLDQEQDETTLRDTCGTTCCLISCGVRFRFHLQSLEWLITVPRPPPSPSSWEARLPAVTKPLAQPTTSAWGACPQRLAAASLCGGCKAGKVADGTRQRLRPLVATPCRTIAAPEVAEEDDVEATVGHRNAPYCGWSGEVRGGSCRTAGNRPWRRGCRCSTRTLSPTLSLRYRGGAEAAPSLGPTGSYTAAVNLSCLDGGYGGWRRGEVPRGGTWMRQTSGRLRTWLNGTLTRRFSDVDPTGRKTCGNGDIAELAAPYDARRLDAVIIALTLLAWTGGAAAAGRTRMSGPASSQRGARGTIGCRKRAPARRIGHVRKKPGRRRGRPSRRKRALGRRACALVAAYFVISGHLVLSVGRSEPGVGEDQRADARITAAGTAGVHGKSHGDEVDEHGPACVSARHEVPPRRWGRSRWWTEGARIGEAGHPGPDSAIDPEEHMDVRTWALEEAQGAAWQSPPTEEGDLEGGAEASTSHADRGIPISLAAALGEDGDQSHDVGYAMARATAAWRASWTAWARLLSREESDDTQRGLPFVERVAAQDARDVARAGAAWARARREEGARLRQSSEEDGRPDDVVDQGEQTCREDLLHIKRAFDKVREAIEGGFKTAQHREDGWLRGVKQLLNEAVGLLAEARERERTGGSGAGATVEPIRVRRRMSRKGPEPAMGQPTSGGDSGGPRQQKWGGLVAAEANRTAASRNRRRGSGATKRSSLVTIFYGNVTSLSKKAEDYLVKSTAEVWMAGETHIRDAKLDECIGRLEKGGWTITAAPAAKSDQSVGGTWGGAICAAKAHIATQHLIGDERTARRSAITKAPDLAMRVLNIMGGDILMIAGYARGGESAQQIGVVAEATRAGALPFIWMADFNESPEDVSSRTWVRDLRATVVRPSNAEITCHQRGGSAVDFAVMSIEVANYVESLEAVEEVPWGPHVGLLLKLRRNPRAAMTRTYRRPRPLEEAATCAERGPAFEVRWEDAQAWAKQEVQRNMGWAGHPALAQQRRLAQGIGFADEAEELGARLEQWARATEIQALARQGIKHTDEVAARFSGRARPMILSTKPLRVPCRIGGDQPDGGGAGEVTAMWATCRAMAAKIRNALRHHQMERARALRAKVLLMVASSRGAVPRAWGKVSNLQDAAAARFAIMQLCRSDAGADAADAAVKTLTRLENTQHMRDANKARNTWKAWVAKALKEGAGAAHKWCNAPNVQRPNAQIGDTLMASANKHAKDWSKQWGGDDAEGARVAIQAVASLRSRVLGAAECMSFDDGLAPAALRKRAAKFRKSTGIGSDNTEFALIAGSSDESMEELSAIMKRGVKSVAYPVQVLTVLENLIGKKDGGTRATALCTSYYRLLMGSASDRLRKWDSGVALADDTAVAGQDLQVQSMRRQLLVEAAVANGRHAITILWDVKKFFDSIYPDMVINAAEDLAFPADILGMAMIMHRAPRTIVCDGCAADPVGLTARSVLAGCMTSTSLARGLVRRPIAKASTGDDHLIFQHVDDLTQIIIADTARQAIIMASRHGEDLANGIKGLRLEVSTKSELVASSPEVADAVVRNLQREGITIRRARCAEDVGVTTSAGRQRAVAAQGRRLDRADARSHKVKQLVAVDKRAVSLQKTGTAPQATYGATVQGASPAQVVRHRRQAVRACPNTGPQPCTTALLHWMLGPGSDPEVQLCRRQAEHWIKTWGKLNAAHRKEVRRAWKTLLPQTVIGGVEWAKVSGPAQATIATLTGIGWKPAAPDVWFNRDGTSKAMVGSEDLSARREILDAVQADAERKVWEAASGHFLGGGLQRGRPTLEPARKARRWLVKHGLLDQARALDSIVCGSAWPGGRGGIVIKCECGAVETPWHRYWGCELLNDMDDEAVKDTQHLARVMLQDEFHPMECLWGRAILPWTLDAGMVGAVEDEALRIFTPRFSEEFHMVRRAYTDGSGGLRHAPSSVRRAGSGVAVIDIGMTEDGNGERVEKLEMAIGGVSGRQTSARAELVAAAMVIRSSRAEADITIHPDATYITGGFHKWRDVGRCKGANGSMWEDLYRETDDKGLTVNVDKVKAHVDVKEYVQGQMVMRDFVGNFLADALAGAAAQRAQSDLAPSLEVERWHGRAFMIAKRLACIEAHAWQRQRTLCAPCPLPEWQPPQSEEAGNRLAEAIAASGHRLRTRRGRMFCVRCRRHRAISDYDTWTTQPCVVKRRAEARREIDRLSKRLRTHDRMLMIVDDESAGATPAQRRRLITSIKRDAEWRKGQISVVNREAWQKMAAAISLEAFIEIEYSPSPPPFEVHESHVVIECGGYLGCVLCAAVSGFWTKTALTRECRRGALATSKRPIRRLAQGRLPHLQKDGSYGTDWPSGEAEPRPKRWRRINEETWQQLAASGGSDGTTSGLEESREAAVAGSSSMDVG